ncbi:MAG TPA: cupredoxin domain-containing protein [Rhodopseudomonas sp.]|uniref:cupredoxin domain-containing protein n=1 Tax=Rhodopseudomonas sp. TaxID=1078 RepID=UPI002EDA3214
MNLLRKTGRTACSTRRPVFLLVAAILLPLAATATARADDEPSFRIEFRDGKVTPSRLEVPANTRFKLDLHNLGQEPAEFESKELRKEKVLAPGTSSTLVIRTLDPGEYDFFDDFHLDAPPAVLVAK